MYTLQTSFQTNFAQVGERGKIHIRGDCESKKENSLRILSHLRQRIRPLYIVKFIYSRSTHGSCSCLVANHNPYIHTVLVFFRCIVDHVPIAY
jgi:hypothetical protein